MEKKKFYITTSIAYTNAPPHLGYALELVQADVIARYHRSQGEDVFFLTGTDEHGKKVAEAAEKTGKSPEEFTNEISEKFRELTKVLNISNNDFIRTTDKKRHWPAVKNVWLKLQKNGDIYKKKYKGLYCVGCEAFVKEKDLVDGKCPIHRQKPEVIEEENYFFKLSKYADKIKEKIENGEMKIIPEKRRNEILSFIGQGVEDVSCSRAKNNLKWGIPVPGDDFQIIYVWFEALINYLYPQGYWPADVQCIGKDIFRFHALWWPAILLATKKPLPQNILIHGFITSAGQKMSKSLGNVVDPFELIKKYGVDPVRYFLLREIPSTEDGDFSYKKFEQRYNSDLAKGLGNLVARVITMARNSPPRRGEARPKDLGGKFQTVINETTEGVRKKLKKSLEEFRFNEALEVVWELISFCDGYIEKEKPWSFDPAQDKERQNEVIGNLLVCLEEIAKILKPFLPETSEKIFKQLTPRPFKALQGKRGSGQEIKRGEIIFPRI